MSGPPVVIRPPDWGRGARLPALGLIPGGSFDPEVVSRLKQTEGVPVHLVFPLRQRPGSRQPARPLADAAAAVREPHRSGLDRLWGRASGRFEAPDRFLSPGQGLPRSPAATAGPAGRPPGQRGGHAGLPVSPGGDRKRHPSPGRGGVYRRGHPAPLLSSPVGGGPGGGHPLVPHGGGGQDRLSAPSRRPAEHHAPVAVGLDAPMPGSRPSRS